MVRKNYIYKGVVLYTYKMIQKTYDMKKPIVKIIRKKKKNGRAFAKTYGKKIKI